MIIENVTIKSNIYKWSILQWTLSLNIDVYYKLFDFVEYLSFAKYWGVVDEFQLVNLIDRDSDYNLLGYHITIP